MRKFNIKPVDFVLTENISDDIFGKTRPYGDLGKIEEISLKMAQIQNTRHVEIKKPHLLLFASDHGIAQEKVSIFPQELSYQLVLNVMSGKSPINLFADQHQMEVLVIDAGIRYDFNPNFPIIHAKIRKGTRNFLVEPAMTTDEMEKAIETGVSLVDKLHENGCNTIGLGEMGVANTSSASVLTALITQKSIRECVDTGSGLDTQGVEHKVTVLNRAIERHGNPSLPLDLLRTYGGYETAMTIGAILRAAELDMIVLVDGFITSAAMLLASVIEPEISRFCFFSHQSKEQGHKQILDFFGHDALINLNLRLGEGTGAALALPVIKSGANFLRHLDRMASMGF